MQHGDLATSTRHRLVVVLEGVIATVTPIIEEHRWRADKHLGWNYTWHEMPLKRMANIYRRYPDIAVEVLTFLSQDVADLAADFFNDTGIPFDEVSYHQFSQLRLVPAVPDRHHPDHRLRTRSPRQVRPTGARRPAWWRLLSGRRDEPSCPRLIHDEATNVGRQQPDHRRVLHRPAVEAGLRVPDRSLPRPTASTPTRPSSRRNFPSLHVAAADAADRVPHRRPARAAQEGDLPRRAQPVPPSTSRSRTPTTSTRSWTSSPRR